MVRTDEIKYLTISPPPLILDILLNALFTFPAVYHNVPEFLWGERHCYEKRDRVKVIFVVYSRLLSKNWYNKDDLWGDTRNTKKIISLSH